MRSEDQILTFYSLRCEALGRAEIHCLEHHAQAHYEECEFCWPAIEPILREISLLEWILGIEKLEDVPPEPMCGPWEEDSHAEE